MVDKKKSGSCSHGKNKGKWRDVDCVSVEEERVFHNLSTTYQQIVDNVGKDMHGTHREILSTIFSWFLKRSKIPLTKADFFYIIEKMFNYN